MIGDPPPLADIVGSPSNEKHVAVYDKIGDPPSLAGAVKLTIAEPTPPATATPITGGPGTEAPHGAVANGDAAVNQVAAFTAPVV